MDAPTSTRNIEPGKAVNNCQYLNSDLRLEYSLPKQRGDKSLSQYPSDRAVLFLEKFGLSSDHSLLQGHVRRLVRFFPNLRACALHLASM